jgi:hypothetical protein
MRKRRVDESVEHDRVVVEERVGPRDVLGVAGSRNWIAAELDEASDHADLGTGLKESHLTREAFGMALVVGIEASDECAAGEVATKLKGVDEASGELKRAGLAVCDRPRASPKEADARIASTPRFDDRGPVVGRAIVDGQQFPIRKRLRGDAGQGSVERASGIVKWHQDRGGRRPGERLTRLLGEHRYAILPLW